MKKILLILTVCFLVSSVNTTAAKKDREYIKEYIKEIDAKIDAEFNKDPREKYKKPLSEEEQRKVPFSSKGEVIIEYENGYYNVYDAFTHVLKKSFTLTKKDKPYGVYKFFYDDGKLMKIGFVDKGGKNSGTVREYYPSGKLHKLIPYYKGSLEGERIFYFENGKIQEKYTYINSKEEGEGTIYYENGKPMVVETYKNGKKEGPYKLYDPEGNLREIGVNKNGKPVPEKQFNY